MSSRPQFAEPSSAAIPITVVEANNLDIWISEQTIRVANLSRAHGFSGNLSEFFPVTDEEGNTVRIVAGFGSPPKRLRGRFHLAGLAKRLPEGTYRFEGLDEPTLAHESLGWLFAQYAFDKYKTQHRGQAHLTAPVGANRKALEAAAAAEFLIRDLINTPASDMSPENLEQAAHAIADAQGAGFKTVKGDDLLVNGFPLIHTVGRAAAVAPRLIDMHWGTQGPRLTLVGKGVCFDTGGLNLKPGSSMGLMKKDMGGAATVLGLAQMIMQRDLPIRLRVLIPAVENAVAGDAFRPGDILTSRNGLTIEINNTDAEGRLVLGDALALAVEDESPDLLISMATLTGAARVAVGPDLSPFYTNDEEFARALEAGARSVADPVWRMPFHEPYEDLIEPDIADLDNAPTGGFAGSITAALFLRRFAGSGSYAHFDIYGWNPVATAARPKGGTGMGARAILAAIESTWNL